MTTALRGVTVPRTVTPLASITLPLVGEVTTSVTTPGVPATVVVTDVDVDPHPVT